MARALEETTAAGAPGVVPRRARVVIRRVGPWSVLRFSLLFYFCVMLVVWLALMFLWAIMSAVGVVESVEGLLKSVSLVSQDFRFDSRWIFTRLFLVGVGLVVLWSLINVFVAFLYNLCSDVVGGIEVTLAERR